MLYVLFVLWHTFWNLKCWWRGIKCYSAIVHIILQHKHFSIIDRANGTQWIFFDSCMNNYDWVTEAHMLMDDINQVDDKIITFKHSIKCDNKKMLKQVNKWNDIDTIKSLLSLHDTLITIDIFMFWWKLEIGAFLWLIMLFDMQCMILSWLQKQ